MAEEQWRRDLDELIDRSDAEANARLEQGLAFAVESMRPGHEELDRRSIYAKQGRWRIEDTDGNLVELGDYDREPHQVLRFGEGAGVARSVSRAIRTDWELPPTLGQLLRVSSESIVVENVSAAGGVTSQVLICNLSRNHGRSKLQVAVSSNSGDILELVSGRIAPNGDVVVELATKFRLIDPGPLPDKLFEWLGPITRQPGIGSRPDPTRVLERWRRGRRGPF